jgi:pimeloyl-ACP methyl ester carboxylesterase
VETTQGGVDIRHERVQGDGVELHVARAGDGPPVVLLHGFPENWTSWRRQMPVLARAGFSVLAPDMRGYNLSDRPAEREAYHLRHLVADVAALIRSTGHARAHVVGHDWGGIVAWTFAGLQPELLHRLVVMNAPHMRIYTAKARRGMQLLRSWYVGLFRIPGLAERLLSAGSFAAVRHLLGSTPARARTFSAEDIERYVEALARPGALAAALDYYRANMAPGALALAREARAAAETLVIWGERDAALGVELLDGLELVAPRVRIHRIPDAGHWVQNEAPRQVNRALVEFLRS